MKPFLLQEQPHRSVGYDAGDEVDAFVPTFFRRSAMSSVVLDSKSLEKLRQGQGRVEIRDEAGQLAGYFIPPHDRLLEASLYGGIEVPFTDEDLDRFEQEPGGRSLVEILDDLAKRS
jgi:hypothetical protein